MQENLRESRYSQPQHFRAISKYRTTVRMTVAGIAIETLSSVL